jgi:hypothetical protein
MKITFEPFFEFSKDHAPIPAKKMLPEWIKNLPPIVTNELGNTFRTAKKCPPMIDFLTSGYYMLSPGNFKFRREVNNNEEDIFINGDMYVRVEEENKVITIPTMSHHTHDQAPIVINGIKKSIWKFNQFWAVHTPPGYSCIYLPPLFFCQHFQMFPAIVDTDDGFGVPQSFPVMSVYNDNSIHEWGIKKGEPLALVIPFKRDDWEHEIADIELANREIALDRNKQRYARDFHKKKNFK